MSIATRLMGGVAKGVARGIRRGAGKAAGAALSLHDRRVASAAAARATRRALRGTASVAAIAAAASPIAIAAFVWHENESLVTTRIDVPIDGLPAELEGFRIAHLSDLHDAAFGRGNSRLLSLVESLRPDAIAITGDIMHSEGTRNALALARGCAAIAPTMFVTGNHESYTTRSVELIRRMRDAGVAILDGVVADGADLSYPASDADAFSRVAFAGIPDLGFAAWDERADPAALVTSELAGLAGSAAWPAGDDGRILVLLAHRPELVMSYADPRLGIDLVLAGHAHGGQWRVPGIGGLYAPSQGVLPRYDAGLYRVGGTRMVVSRGLGNSGFPLRLNNRPEVVLVTLRRGGGGSGAVEVPAEGLAGRVADRVLGASGIFELD